MKCCRTLTQLLCDDVEFEAIDFDHHIHFNASDGAENVSSYYKFETKFIFIRYSTLTESN
jgi:hypothetical protein